MTNKKVLIILVLIFISLNYSKLLSTSTTFIKENGEKIEINKPSQILTITNGNKETTKDMSPDNPIAVIVQLSNSPILSKKTKKSSSKRALMAQIAGEQYQIEAEIHSVFSSMNQKFKDVELPVPQIKHRYQNTFNGVAMTIPQCMLKSIKKIPGVKRVFLDSEVNINLDKSVAEIGAKRVHEQLGLTGKDVLVGIIDTGVDYTHPALGGGIGPDHKVIGGYDVINGDDDPIDDHGHGTHVAGIVAGNTQDWTGVAPDARLLAVKVLNFKGSGFFSEIIAGIEYAVDPDNNPETDDGVDIINMSLGGSGSPDDPLCQAVNTAVNAGVVCVVAAGNAGNYNQIGSPGLAKNAITVGASNSRDIAEFSSRGPALPNEFIKPDIMAPGVNIESSVLGWSLEEYSGTSMATPHVAGVAALLLEGNPDWTPETVKGVLCGTATDLGFDPFSQGTGQVNAWRAANSKTSVTTSNLGFESSDFNQDQTYREKYLKLHNLSDSSATYQLSLTRALPAGVAVQFSPTSLTIEPGQNDSTLVSITVDNNTIPIANIFSNNIFGRIAITSEKDTLAVPFALVHMPTVQFEISNSFERISIHKNTANWSEQFSISIGEPDSVFSMVVPVGEYDMYCFFGDQEKDEFTLVHKRIEIQDTQTIQMKSSDATCKIGMEIPKKIRDQFPFYMAIYSLEFGSINFNYINLGYAPVCHLSPITESENCTYSYYTFAKKSDAIYLANQKYNVAQGDNSLQLDAGKMRKINYEINTAPYVSDEYKYMYTYIKQGTEIKYSLLVHDEPYILGEDARYNLYCYPTYEESDVSIRLDFKTQQQSSHWTSQYFRVLDDRILTGIGAVEREIFFSGDSIHFGVGITPPIPLIQLHPQDDYFIFPRYAYEFLFQANDRPISNEFWPQNYQLYNETGLLEQGEAEKRMKLPNKNDKYRVVLDYPNIVKFGMLEHGDIQLESEFDTRQNEYTPPEINDFKTLSNGMLYNPAFAPENVVLQAKFSDNKDELSLVQFQYNHTGETEWHNLETTANEGFHEADIPESLLANEINIKVIAADKDNNRFSYTLLPAFTNQATTRISNISVSPGYILPGQQLKIQAKIEDEEGVSRAMAEVISADESQKIQLKLFDDGNHNDGASNDGIYSNSVAAPAEAANFQVDLIITDHLGQEIRRQNMAQFTTLNVPYIALKNRETTCDILDTTFTFVLKNFGALKAENLKVSAQAYGSFYFEPQEYELEIEKIDVGQEIPINFGIKQLRRQTPDSTSILQRITIKSDNLVWDDDLNLLITGNPGPEFSYSGTYSFQFQTELKAKPLNVKPGENISLVRTVYDPDGVRGVWSYFIDAQSGSVIDSLRMLRCDDCGNTYECRWKTGPEPMDYRIQLYAEDSLGNSSVEIPRTGFTTRTKPDGDSDVLIIGSYENQSDTLLENIINSVSAINLTSQLWNRTFRGDCDFQILDKYPEKGIVWQPEVFSPFVLSERNEYKKSTETEHYKLKRFMDMGGRLLIFQSDFAHQLCSYSDDLVDAYLPYQKASVIENVNQIIGSAGDVIGDQLKFKLKENAIIEGLELTLNSIPILKTENGEVVAFRVSGEKHHAVFLAFDPTEIEDSAQRNLLLSRIFDWFKDPLANLEEDQPELPKRFALLSNYPNPFNPQTTIKYQMPKASSVTVKIYDLLGREVITLLNDQLKAAGTHSLIWDGQDKAGNTVSSGIYFCRFQAGDFKSVMKMALLK